MVIFFVTYRTFSQFFPLPVTLKRKLFILEYCYISEFSLICILYILCQRNCCHSYSFGEKAVSPTGHCFAMHFSKNTYICLLLKNLHPHIKFMVFVLLFGPFASKIYVSTICRTIISCARVF